GANPDLTGPTEKGIIPATGALIAPIEMAAGCRAYFLGKPNPLMMRRAVKQLRCRCRDAVIIGDRMDTDIVAGLESEVDTVLVLSGVTSLAMLDKFPYQPNYIYSGLDELVARLKES
ncbi:MAG: HAD hydrolase-like protein, partial [Victivallales bacterium]|nr:HAD hydrolase-like protein [Victivallales bacterium]